MNKAEYRKLVEGAVDEFLNLILNDFPDELEEGIEMDLAQANDELMLAVYEYTHDGRRA